MAAQFGSALIGQAAEQGQQEQGQHVIRGHDHTGNAFADAKGFGEDLGDQVVVHLPERADRQERKAH